MKLSEIPWPGDVIAQGEQHEDEEVAIAIPGTLFVMTICAEVFREGHEYSVVVRKNTHGTPIQSMAGAYDLPPANGRSSERGNREVSRFELTSIFELLAAVDYFAQKFGANLPE